VRDLLNQIGTGEDAMNWLGSSSTRHLFGINVIGLLGGAQGEINDAIDALSYVLEQTAEAAMLKTKMEHDRAAGTAGAGDGSEQPPPPTPFVPMPGASKVNKADVLRPFREQVEIAEKYLEYLKYMNHPLDEIIKQTQVVEDKKLLLARKEAEIEKGGIVDAFGINFEHNKSLIEGIKGELKESIDNLDEVTDLAKTTPDAYKAMIDAIFGQFSETAVAPTVNVSLKGLPADIAAKIQAQIDAAKNMAQMFGGDMEAQAKFAQEISKLKFEALRKQRIAYAQEVGGQFEQGIPQELSPAQFQAMSSEWAGLANEIRKDDIGKLVMDSLDVESKVARRLWDSLLKYYEDSIKEFADKARSMASLATTGDLKNFLQTLRNQSISDASETKFPFFGPDVENALREGLVLNAAKQFSALRREMEAMDAPIKQLKVELDDLIRGVPTGTERNTLESRIENAQHQVELLKDQFTQLAEETRLTDDQISALFDLVRSGASDTDIGKFISNMLGASLKGTEANLTAIMGKIRAIVDSIHDLKELAITRQKEADAMRLKFEDFISLTPSRERIRRAMEKAISDAVKMIEEDTKPRAQVEIDLLAKLKALRSDEFKTILQDGIIDSFREGFSKFFDAFFEGKGNLAGFLQGLGEGLKNTAKQFAQYWVDNIIRAFMPSPIDVAATQMNVAADKMNVAADKMVAAVTGAGASDASSSTVLPGTVRSGSSGSGIKGWLNGLKAGLKNIMDSLMPLVAGMFGSAVFGGGPGASTGAMLGASLGPSLFAPIFAGLGLKLGAFGGPVGMVLGGLLGGFVGNLFGKGGNDAALRLDKQRNEMLDRIDHSLRPMSDYFRFLSREAIWGPGSSHFSGRALSGNYGVGGARGAR
jgi:hypothetical protein